MMVLVKGSPGVAIEAAQSRGVPFPLTVVNVLHPMPGRTETVLDVSDSSVDIIMRWFGETVRNDSPFPAGTCLHYKPPAPVGN